MFLVLRTVGVAFTAHISSRRPKVLWSIRLCFFKDVDELAIPACNLVNGGLARGCFVPPSDERFPEVGAPNGEADEARDSGRDCQPLAHPLVVRAAAQDYASNFVPAAPARGRNYLLAVLPPVETFDLPDVRLNFRVLQLLNGLNHEARPNFQVIGILVPLDPIKLRLLCRHQQFKHEEAAALAVQVLR